jgi:hypothetical protein
MRLKSRNGKIRKNRKNIYKNDKRIRKSVVLVKHMKGTESKEHSKNNPTTSFY